MAPLGGDVMGCQEVIGRPAAFGGGCYNIRLMERYRSGHNGAASKADGLQGHVGSNPTLSGSYRSRVQERYRLGSESSLPSYYMAQ